MLFENFNPRPRAGSDISAKMLIHWRREFQSTPPSGERRLISVYKKAADEISIHAPERGATWPGISRPSDQSTFQSTPPSGERPTSPELQHCASRFQSTPPSGERLRDLLYIPGGGGFQSTPPSGERPEFDTVGKTGGEFQSTPPSGERPFCW